MRFFLGCLVAASVGGCGAVLGWYHKHPCLRYETQMCAGGISCATYDIDMNCMFFENEPDRPCEVCVERK